MTPRFFFFYFSNRLPKICSTTHLFCSKRFSTLRVDYNLLPLSYANVVHCSFWLDLHGRAKWLLPTTLNLLFFFWYYCYYFTSFTSTFQVSHTVPDKAAFTIHNMIQILCKWVYKHRRQALRQKGGKKSSKYLTLQWQWEPPQHCSTGYTLQKCYFFNDGLAFFIGSVSQI